MASSMPFVCVCVYLLYVIQKIITQKIIISIPFQN